jgi:hypothetical protein
MINTEGVKILMIHVLMRAIQDYRANNRAIKRLRIKYDECVDLEKSIEIFTKMERLKGENDAIERYLFNKNSNCYHYTDLEPDYVIRLFRKEVKSDDERASSRNS